MGPLFLYCRPTIPHGWWYHQSVENTASSSSHQGEVLGFPGPLWSLVILWGLIEYCTPLLRVTTIQMSSRMISGRIARPGPTWSVFRSLGVARVGRGSIA